MGPSKYGQKVDCSTARAMLAVKNSKNFVLHSRVDFVYSFDGFVAILAKKVFFCANRYKTVGLISNNRTIFDDYVTIRAKNIFLR